MPIKSMGAGKTGGPLKPIEEEKPMLALPMSEGGAADKTVTARAVVALPNTSTNMQ